MWGDDSYQLEVEGAHVLGSVCLCVEERGEERDESCAMSWKGQSELSNSRILSCFQLHRCKGKAPKLAFNPVYLLLSKFQFIFFVKLVHLHARNLPLIYSDNDSGKQVENVLLLPEGPQCGKEDSKVTFS